MKMVKVLLVLYFGASLFFMSCAAEPDIGPPAAVVAAFKAVRDAALGPVDTALTGEEAGDPGEEVGIDWPETLGPHELSYTGTLTEYNEYPNTRREYDLVITTENLSHPSYTISGTVDMTMSITVDDTGKVIDGSLTLDNGDLTLEGGEITSITVTNVTVNLTTGAATGTITFDEDEYPASDFNFR